KSLPRDRTVIAATLSDSDSSSWTYWASSHSTSTYYSDSYAGFMAFKLDPNDATHGWVAFPPNRDENGSNLLLRLTFDDGSFAIAQVKAGAIVLSKLSPAPSDSTIAAAPGADLNALAEIYGKIQLSPGKYRLNAPLVLNHPITINAPLGGATLLFAQ